MALKDIQLAHIDAVDRARGKFTVTAHADDCNQMAIFDCDSERDGLALRNAIRDHATRLRRAADYRHDTDKRIAALESALVLAQRMCKEALPKFDWGASCLDANAIMLLNQAPLAIDAALEP